jgi:hypothetical protein
MDDLPLQAREAVETAKLSSSIWKLPTLSPANINTMANSLSISLPLALTHRDTGLAPLLLEPTISASRRSSPRRTRLVAPQLHAAPMA